MNDPCAHKYFPQLSLFDIFNVNHNEIQCQISYDNHSWCESLHVPKTFQIEREKVFKSHKLASEKSTQSIFQPADLFGLFAGCFRDSSFKSTLIEPIEKFETTLRCSHSSGKKRGKNVSSPFIVHNNSRRKSVNQCPSSEMRSDKFWVPSKGLQ